MKKLIASLSMICLSLGIVLGQTSDQKIGLSANIGLSDYYGDWNNAFFNTGKAYRTQVGIAGTYSLSPMFNLGLAANYGSFGFHVPGIAPSEVYKFGFPAKGFTSTLFTSSLQLRFKFNNGMILEENSMFRPYIFVGGGVADISQNNAPSGVTGPKGLDFTGNAGLGFDVMFTDNIGVNYNMNYGYTTSDDRDFLENVRGGNDQFMIHSIGVLYLLGKASSQD